MSEDLTKREDRKINLSARKGEKKRIEDLSPTERRVVRAERVSVCEAEPYGWIARSESDPNLIYHLFCDPQTRRLVCTCADFAFRGDAVPGFECKHIVATLKFIARRYLAREYDPQRQLKRAA